jgi:energy-coupling factor transporter ATP-binding protein EcfA2
MQPHYIILDESTSLLDTVSRKRLLGAVERLLDETGAGLILISMRIEDIWFCPRVIFLRGGTVDFEGSRAEVFEYVRTLGLPLQGLPLLVSELEEFVPDLVRRLDQRRVLSADSLSHVLVGLRWPGTGGQDCR